MYNRNIQSECCLQEPMLNAATEQFGRNPFAGLMETSTAGNNPQQGTENRDPLPNPWSAASSPRSTTRAPADTTTGTDTGRTAQPPTAGAATDGNPMAAIMRQFMENPQLMRSMMGSSQVQSMMQEFAANPNLLATAMNSNPLFAGNPNLLSDMRNIAPMLPEMQQLLFNQVKLKLSFTS